MGYIKKIGFGNYRVFKEFNEFELAPISIITGPNNSGKSSFFKGIKLLANNAKDNDLTFLKYSEGTFSCWKTLTNNETENSELTAKIGTVKFKGKELDYYVHFKNGNLIKVSLSNIGELVFSIAFKSIENEITKTKLKINLEFFEENKASIEPKEEIIQILDDTDFAILGNAKDHQFTALSRITRMSAKNFNTLNFPEIEYKPFEKSIDKDDSIFLDIPEGVKFLELYIHQKLCYQPTYSDWENKNIISFMNPDFTLKSIYGKLLEIYGYSFEEVQKIISEDKSDSSINFDPELFHTIGSFLKGLKKASLKINASIKLYSEYEPKFTFKDRLVLKKDLSFSFDFKQLSNENSEISKFINKHINKFGLGEKFLIREIENFAYAFELVDNGVTYSFSDLGTGYSQIIELLLKIASVGSQSYECIGGYYDPKPQVLLIEEPEMSLHPSLQSKLADVFADAINLFSIQLIVETHSEYLIRKLQYLVAKKVVQKNSTVIYYFNARETQKKSSKKVFTKIEINSNGTLTEQFGKGFFDEATNWELELIKLNSIQAN